MASGLEGEETRPTALRVVVATNEDEERVVCFLRSEFFPDEPINAIVGTTRGPADARSIRALSSLANGEALLAVNASGEVLGACLCNELSSEREDRPESGADDYAAVLAVLARAAQAAAVAEAEAAQRSRRPAPDTQRRVLEVRVLAVAASARRRGVAAQLLEGALGVARRHAYRALTMLCTNVHSASLARRAGMQLVHTQPYSDFVDCGLLLRAPPEPHTHITCYVYELSLPEIVHAYATS